MIRTNRFASAMFMQAVVEGNTGGNTNEATKAPEAATVNAANAEADKQAKFAKIKSDFKGEVEVKETSFYFRKVVNEIKNPDGTTSKVETKRPTVVLPIPIPNVEGIVSILQAEGKQLDLLLEAVANVIIEQAREYVNEHEDVNSDNFPYEKMAWEFIANLPKAERRGGGISKELWDDFEKDYIEIMPGLTQKKKEQVEMAAKVFKTKFAGATTNKPVLTLLEGQLALYAANTTQGETLLPCIEFLQGKLEKLLNNDETKLLLAL